MEREVHATICEARQLMVSSVAAISQMIDEKDRYTSEHSHRVAEYARLIGAHMGFAGEELDSLYRSALLHDIGKIAVPDAILNKPSRLTDEEFDIMKRHTTIGAAMLDQLHRYRNEPLVRTAHEICRWHHERWDGRGYPDGLSGDQIPISAQVVAMADVYDALVSKRVYKDAYAPDVAVQMILHGDCGAFNPLLLECLTDLQDTFKAELAAPEA